MVVLDTGGVVSALAGPVTSFILVAKDRETLAATQLPASIKSMDITLQMADEEAKVSDVSYSTTVYFQKDWVSAFYYGLYAYGTMTLSGSGTIVAEGSVDVTKQHVTINPVAGNPGIICGDSISIIKDLICNWTVFAKNTIDITGSDVSIVASTGQKMALGTLGNIIFFGGTLSVSGMIVSQGSTSLSNVSTISLTAPSNYAAIVANGLSVTGGTFTVSGSLISKGNIYINTKTATISGLLASAENVTILSNVAFTTDTTALQDPMAYVFTQ